jgi:hypothetical protein
VDAHRGSRMLWGWRYARLTASQMRKHFTDCAERIAASDNVEPPSEEFESPEWNARRGGGCGRGRPRGASSLVSRMHAHLAGCSRRPRA